MFKLKIKAKAKKGIVGAYIASYSAQLETLEQVFKELRLARRAEFGNCEIKSISIKEV